MSPNPDKLRLNLFANWQLRPRTLGEFVDECFGFLKGLQPLHPLFREGLCLRGRSKTNSPELNPDLSNFEPLLLKRAWNHSASPSCCDNLGPDGMPTRQSKTDLGFYCTVSNLRSPWKDNIQIDLGGGSTNPQQGGGVGIDLPYDGGAEFSDPAFLRQLIEMVVDHWRPEQVGIGNRLLFKAVEIEGARPRPNPVSWLTYLDDPAVEAVLPPDVDRCALGSGILFTLQPEPPREPTPSLREKAIRVRDALLPGEWMTPRACRSKALRAA